MSAGRLWQKRIGRGPVVEVAVDRIALGFVYFTVPGPMPTQPGHPREMRMHESKFRSLFEHKEHKERKESAPHE